MAVDGLFPSPGSQTVAEASEESEYIASRMDGLPVGPSLSYTFENQEGLPYDGTNRMARKLSPFTLRLVPPAALLPEDTSVDVNLIGRGSATVAENNNLANQLRNAIGQATIFSTAQAETRLVDLNSALSAGRVLATMVGTEQRSVLADNVTLADIQYQVERILQTPPLTLFVNPTDMSITYTAVQQYSQRTRYGKVFERWGEEQPKLSISGSTGAWCAGIDPGTSIGGASGFQVNDTDTPTGVQFASKRNSAAFQQFMALYHIYRNNGYIYDTVDVSEAMLFVGAVAIDYDQMTYVGNIDSFEYSYDEGSPHRIEWSMEFTVGRMYDHAESPIIVLPESSPTVTPGSFSTAELAKMMEGTPSRTDIAGYDPARDGPGLSLLGLSGTRQFTGDEDVIRTGLTVDGERVSDGRVTQAGDPDSTTPLEALGAFFTPTGTFDPGLTD